MKIMKFHKCLLICALIIYFKTCNGFPSNYSEPTVCTSSICQKTAENLLNSMDQTVNPCSNFYQYACGKFLKANPVPVNKIEYGKFTIVAESVRDKIQGILTLSEKENMPSAIKSSFSLYKSCTETTESSSLVLELLISKLGGCPLIANEQWDANSYNVIGAIYNNMIYGNCPFFTVDVGVDEKNSSANIIYVDQVDMNLDNDYYLDSDGYEHVIEAYVELIANTTRALLGNISEDIVKEMARRIVRIETAIANVSSSFLDRQNSTRMYNRMTVGQLQNLTDPDKNVIDWVDFLQGLLKLDDITEDEPIIVNEIYYMDKLFEILNATDKDDLANYIAWNYLMYIVDDAWGVLEEMYFDFQQIIGGAKNRTERWEKCTDNVGAAFSFAIGQLYVNNYTDDHTRIDALNMLKLLQSSFIGRLHGNGFMDNDTQIVAINKVNSMLLLVGYPDWIGNITGQKEYYENVKYLKNQK